MSYMKYPGLQIEAPKFLHFCTARPVRSRPSRQDVEAVPLLSERIMHRDAARHIWKVLQKMM